MLHKLTANANNETREGSNQETSCFFFEYPVLFLFMLHKFVNAVLCWLKVMEINLIKC